jgi:hypothetical protein
MESDNFSETTVTQTSRVLFLKPDENEKEEEKLNYKKLKSKQKKNVIWSEDTIDNENMNKLKSNSI